MFLQKGSSPSWDMFGIMSPRCPMILFEIEDWLKQKQLEICVTSLIRPKTTDSGIHAVGRAADFIICKIVDHAVIPYVNYVHDSLLIWVNSKYFYDPVRKTIMYHKVDDPTKGGYHFHLQVSH